MPPLKSASRIASCSACIVRSSSSVAYGLPKPLASSRSDSFATRSSRSRSSSSSPVYFVYRYFTACVLLPTPYSLVVILLLRARHRNRIIHRLFFAARALTRRRLGGRVAPVVAAADLPLRVQALEDEIDRGGGRRRRRAGREAGVFGQL